MKSIQQLQILKDLVNINSYTANKSGVDMVVDYLQSIELDFKQKIDSKRIPHDTHGDLLIWSSKETIPNKPQILLSVHLDTVHPPDLDFKFEVDDNIIKGPGTLDLKGGVVIILAVLSELSQLKMLNNITVTFIPDEETGSQTHKNYLSTIYKSSDYALVFEDGGKTYPDTYDSTKRSLTTSRKGVLKYTVTSFGAGGHAGTLDKKEERISAIHNMSAFIVNCLNLEDYTNNTTINVGTISGGTTFNTIAEKCQVEIDIRFNKYKELDRIKKKISDMVQSLNIDDNRFTIEEDLFIPPFEKTNDTMEFFRIVKGIGKQLGINITSEDKGGGSDANQISYHDVITLDGFGPCGHDDHTTNEFLYLDSINQSVALTISTLQDLIHK